MNLDNPQPPATERPREDKLWAGLEFPVLSLEELARQQANVEDSVHRHQGIWWRRARPFFWQPCFPYQRIDPKLAWPSRLRSLGGYTHLTNERSGSNGMFRAIVHEDLPRYSIASLNRVRRKKIRAGLCSLEIRIVRPDDLLEAGYDVYVSCHSRIHWGRNKCSRYRFVGWMTRMLQQQKRLILGAYYNDRLVAFMLPYACGEILTPSLIVSHSDFLALHPNDVLYHAFLTIGRQTPGSQMADLGPVSSKPSLDNFKLGYGRVQEFPSFTWINPAIRPFLMPRIQQRYPWLQATSSATSAPAAPEECNAI